jgi:hypothetical protein
MRIRRGMPKERLNLTVERDSADRGQRYSQRHGVSISKLVDDFLTRVPSGEERLEPLTPAVRSLIGIGAGDGDRERYRKHLLEKYGR